MNAIKERILGAVTAMDDAFALNLWNFISEEVAWNSIPEVDPDEIDLQMLKEIEQDPDCHEFIPAEEVHKILGLA